MIDHQYYYFFLKVISHVFPNILRKLICKNVKLKKSKCFPKNLKKKHFVRLNIVMI